MLLTITTTSDDDAPATDLGFVLHKHPDHRRSVAISFGHVHVFWPVAQPDRATVAVLAEVDPVGLVRNRRGPAGEGQSLTQYVNDRPYAASSFMSVALGRVFGTAMGAPIDDRHPMGTRPIRLRVRVPVLPCRGGEAILRRLFEPLGYVVDARAIPLDDAFPEWGSSRYFDVTLDGEHLVADLLAHLYVLLPVLDDDKHYWVSSDEIDKLLRRGGEWLREHPDRELITRRYLRHRGRLTDEALARLVDESDADADPDADAARADAEEAAVEDVVSLNEQRLRAVEAAVRAASTGTVIDLGCGEGKLVQSLAAMSTLTRVAGMDVSLRSLKAASRRLRLDQLSDRRRERIHLFQGSLTYRDERMRGYDTATCIEVVEHLDPGRLDAFEQNLFGWARPRTVIVTTPNREFNSQWPTLPAGRLRHRDHRFEWTRAQFKSWAGPIAARHGYTVTFRPIGPEVEGVGAPTQMAVFER